MGDTHVTGVRFGHVKSFTFDENRRAIIEKDGTEEVIGADTVIFAVGQRTRLPENSGLTLGRANSIATEPNSLRTNLPKIYACGDAVYGTRTVIQAVAAGREAAIEIDKALGGDGDISEVLAPVEIPNPGIGKIDHFAEKCRKQEVFRSVDERLNFQPISFGIPDGDVCGEAERCLQCDLRFQITGHRLWSDYTEEAKG